MFIDDFGRVVNDSASSGTTPAFADRGYLRLVESPHSASDIDDKILGLDDDVSEAEDALDDVIAATVARLNEPPIEVDVATPSLEAKHGGARKGAGRKRREPASTTFRLDFHQTVQDIKAIKPQEWPAAKEKARHAILSLHLSRLEQWLALYLLDKLVRARGSFWHSKAQLASESNCHRTSVIRAINRLVTLGVVQQWEAPDCRRRQIANEFTIPVLLDTAHIDLPSGAISSLASSKNSKPSSTDATRPSSVGATTPSSADATPNPCNSTLEQKPSPHSPQGGREDDFENFEVKRGAKADLRRIPKACTIDEASQTARQSGIPEHVIQLAKDLLTMKGSQPPYVGHFIRRLHADLKDVTIAEAEWLAISAGRNCEWRPSNAELWKNLGKHRNDSRLIEEQQTSLEFALLLDKKLTVVLQANNAERSEVLSAFSGAYDLDDTHDRLRSIAYGAMPDSDKKKIDDAMRRLSKEPIAAIKAELAKWQNCAIIWETFYQSAKAGGGVLSAEHQKRLRQIQLT